MFTDTHFHLRNLNEQGIDIPALFSELYDADFSFLMDIGTRCDDIESRIFVAKSAFQSLCEQNKSDVAKKISDVLYFSAGVWPDVDAIKNANDQMKILKEFVENCSEKERLVAIGECGLDHHWNVNGNDHRDESLFDSDLFTKEAEFFEMQIEFARELDKPVVVHSRDAFDGTLSCIKNVGYHNGEIHCFSYGKKEAEAFLDLGWYIAFGGAVTYTKKRCMEDMKDLIRYIPLDRMLMETDAPYLAPVPFRGKTNTPRLIDNTYKFVCEILGMDFDNFTIQMAKNAKNLFLQVETCGII